MVHALHEIHRTLKPDGILIDLRPLLDRWEVEIATGGSFTQAGRVSDLANAVADDQAASAAMARIAAEGAFRAERQESFSFFYYWDTPGEMREHISDTWAGVVHIDDALWRELGSLWAAANADVRVRLRVRIMITRWQKVTEVLG